jgi:hypothetical protein
MTFSSQCLTNRAERKRRGIYITDTQSPTSIVLPPNNFPITNYLSNIFKINTFTIICYQLSLVDSFRVRPPSGKRITNLTFNIRKAEYLKGGHDRYLTRSAVSRRCHSRIVNNNNL